GSPTAAIVLPLKSDVRIALANSFRGGEFCWSFTWLWSHARRPRCAGSSQPMQSPTGQFDELTQRGEEYDQLREFSVVQLIGAPGLAAERMRRAGSAGDQRFHLLTRWLRRHGSPGAGKA